MFVIQNTGSTELAMGDLRLTLKPKQKLDLDRVLPRYLSERSNHLQMAISTGRVKVIEKNNSTEPNKSKQNVDKILEKNNSSLVKEMREMEQRLKESLSKTTSNNTSDQNAALDAIMGKLTSILNAASLPKSKDEEEIVDEKMVDIHTRSLNKMTSNIEGKISHTESVEKSNISDRADELKDFM